MKRFRLAPPFSAFEPITTAEADRNRTAANHSVAYLHRALRPAGTILPIVTIYHVG